jgi:hypothetical protein
MSNNIQKALDIVQNSLADFVNRENFWDDFELTFGTNYNWVIARNIKTSLASKTFIFPRLEVLSDRILGSANRAVTGVNLGKNNISGMPSIPPKSSHYRRKPALPHPQSLIDRVSNNYLQSLDRHPHQFFQSLSRHFPIHIQPIY